MQVILKRLTEIDVLLRDNSVRELHKILVDKLGSKCTICSFKDTRALQVNMEKSNKKFEHSEQFFKFAILNQSQFSLICANCKQIKNYNKEDNL